MMYIKLQRYFGTVRSFLPCGGKLRRRIMADIRNQVYVYVDAHPGCAFSDIEAHFGTPDCIAAACLENMELKDVLRTIRLRRRIISTVTAAAVLVVALWAICVTTIYLEHRACSKGGYFEIIITETHK